MSDENNGHNGCVRVPATKPLAPTAGLSTGKPTVPAAMSRRGKTTERFSSLQVPLLAAVINHLHKNLKDGQEAMQRMENNEMFNLFREEQYQRKKQDLPQSFKETVCDRSICHVSSFILSVLHQGRFSVTECIISMFYLSRFKQSSKITLHAAIWRPLFLTALLISDKVWQDMPVRNSALTKLFPVLSNAELKKLEYEFVTSIKFKVNISPDSFKQFCETLLAEKVEREIHDRVCSSEFVLALTRQEGQTQNPVPEGLHEDHLWADEEEPDLQQHKPFPQQTVFVQSPRAASLNAARSPGGQRPALSLRGPLAAAREAGSRQSHSLGSLGAVTSTPSASGRMSAAMRAMPLTPTMHSQNAQRHAGSPTTPEGSRNLRPGENSMLRQMGPTLAPTSGSASAGCMVRPAVSGGNGPAVPALTGMSSGYPGLRSQCSHREANSPKGPSTSAALRTAASPNREAGTPNIRTPSAAMMRAGSPLQEAHAEATTGMPSASGGSNPSNSTHMLGCSPSAASSAKAGSINNGSARQHQQSKQLFPSAKARPVDSNSQRQTLKDRAAAAAAFQGQGGGRANSMPAPPGAKQPTKPSASTATAATRVAPSGARAVASKLSPQAQDSQQPGTRSQSSAAAAGSSPGHGISYGGVSGMTPRAGLQAQRSRATVPNMRPSPQQQQQQQQVTSPQSPGQPGSPSQGATGAPAYGQPWLMNSAARGRSSSPGYIVADSHASHAHPGSLATTARSAARVLAPGEQGRY